MCCVCEVKMVCIVLLVFDGYLIVVVGIKFIVYMWDGVELNSVVFFDILIYIVSINVVKNFILVGDLEKGLYFFCWKVNGFEKLII